MARGKAQGRAFVVRLPRKRLAERVRGSAMPEPCWQSA